MTRGILVGPAVGIAAALALTGCSDHEPAKAPAVAAAGERRILYYRDPMHPSYTSPSPGKAPDCGMDLEPVYADAALSVGADQQRLIGLKLDKVVFAPTEGHVKASGRVVPDENRVFPIRSGCEGWVTRIFPGSSTGATVRRGQPLVSVYGPEFSTAQRSFLYALRASENPPPVHPGDDPGQPVLTLQEARLLLSNLGIGDAQIDRLAATRQVMLDVELVAPAAGILVSRDVAPRQRFDKDVELFRVADLRHVWIIADLLGDDSASIRPGDTARVSLPGGEPTALMARVSDALPRSDGGSRALKIRLDAENSQRTLRPDMLVDLEFAVSLPAATTVPADAVVDSGAGPTVYVAGENGSFTARRVATGWRFQGRVQVVSGLTAGESVVVSGNTLLDSESRMRHEDAGEHD